MATNEEYLDNLLKAFEEEEKAREKEVRIPQEKTIITDDDEYIQSLLNEMDSMSDNTSETASEDNVDLMSLLGEEAVSEDNADIMSLLGEEAVSEDNADIMSLLGEEAVSEDSADIMSLLGEEAISEDNADIMSLLGAETASEDNTAIGNEDSSEEIMSLLNTSEDDLLKMLQSESSGEEAESIDVALLGNDSGNEWKSDLDELLAAAVDKLDENQDFFGEASTDAMSSDDMDITQLIDGLDNADESLSEISELLKKSDNNEMFATFEGTEQDDAISELTQNDSDSHSRFLKKKRKEKKGTEEKKKSKENKEAGAFGQFFKALLEDEEEEKAEDDTNASADENDELLKQLENEGKKGKKKKEKKEKKKKNKKQDANQGEGTDDNLDGEEDGKGKKKKKKREKKQKEKVEAIPAPKEKSKKVLSRKAFMVLVAFCASLIAIIVCLSAFLPDYVEKKQAREAFYQGNYEEAHVLLYGKNLNESDRLIFDRVSVVLQLDRKLEAYYFNEEAGKYAKALDALMQGVEYYQGLSDKNAFGAGDELELSYRKVLDILSQKYGVDEAKVLEIIAYDDIRYSQWVYSAAEGMEFGTTEEVETEVEATEPEGPQDILPEEEDIIKKDTEN